MGTRLQSSSLRVDIDDGGGVTVSIGTRPIASGPISMADAQSLFDPENPHGLPLGSPDRSVVKAVSDRQCVIEQHFASGVDVHHTMTLEGSDLTISARVDNTSAHPLSWVRFDAMTVGFLKVATGTLSSWHSSYLSHVGPNLTHPSYQSPIGGVYATDGTIGVGCSSVSHLLKRSMFMAAFERDGIIPQNAQLQFFAELQLEPDAAKTVDFTFRFSNSSDWKILLENYRRAYRSEFSVLHYRPDHRPWMYSVPAAESLVAQGNPLGYQGKERRFDTGFGPHAFLTSFVLPVYQAIQGVILWNPQGINPRGASFRPDFDCEPLIVKANLPTLIAKLASMKLHVGLCARPSEMIWPATYATDTVTQLDGRNAVQVRALCERFDHSRTAGYDAYYLDSFGRDWNDFLIARAIRDHLGPDVPMFSEFFHDLILPYCGRYGQIGGMSGTEPVLKFALPGQMEIMRWLMPEMTTAVVVDSKICTPTQMDAAGLTPMAEDWTAASLQKELLPLARKYANGITRSSG